MSSDFEFVQKALERRAALEQEIEKINDSLALFESLMGIRIHELSAAATSGSVASASLGISDSLQAPTSPKQDVSSFPQSGRLMVTRPIAQEEFDNLAEGVLLGAGRPLGSRDLVERFREMGRPVGGVDEVGNMTTKLWRAGKANRIVKLHGGLYWPKNVACPEVGYVPMAIPVAHSVSGNAGENADDGKV